MLQDGPGSSDGGTTVTAECNNRCRASRDCPAFQLDYDSSACYKLDTNTDDTAGLLESTDSRTAYFERICLRVPVSSQKTIKYNI